MNPLPPLTLPSYDHRIRLNPKNGLEEILCTQRRKYVRLTPEEWVRQHFVHYMIEQLGYPAGRVGVEIAIRVGQTEKRCDTVVYDEQGAPLMIVEYKASSVEITQKVFDQILRYNYALRTDYLVVSNGLQHYCVRLNRAANKFEFLPNIPRYEEIICPSL